MFFFAWLLAVAGLPLSGETLSAEALAARIDHHYNALHSLRVNFEQQYEGLGQHRSESGVLLLEKPGRMRWSYSKPPGKIFLLDGRDAYFYSPGQSEVQRVPAKKLDDLRSPLGLLLGHTQLEKELTGLRIEADGDQFVLSGVPKNLSARVASLRFRATEGGTIVGIRLEESDGAVTTFNFSNEEPNVRPGKGDFTFVAPTGTTIVHGIPPE
jgi:outer membrane lipoprotein carrier protein